jgi:hypothetical protein
MTDPASLDDMRRSAARIHTAMNGAAQAAGFIAEFAR